MANPSLWLERAGLLLAVLGSLAIGLDIYSASIKRLMKSHCEAIEQDPGCRFTSFLPMALVWVIETLALAALFGVLFLVPVLALLAGLKALSLTGLGFSSAFPIAFCLGAAAVVWVSVAGRPGRPGSSSGSNVQTLLFLFTIISYFLRSALLTIPVSATLLIDEMVDNERSASLIGVTLLALGFAFQFAATF